MVELADLGRGGCGGSGRHRHRAQVGRLHGRQRRRRAYRVAAGPLLLLLVELKGGRQRLAVRRVGAHRAKLAQLAQVQVEQGGLLEAEQLALAQALEGLRARMAGQQVTVVGALLLALQVVQVDG